MEISPQDQPKPKLHRGPLLLFILSLTLFASSAFLYYTSQSTNPLLSPLSNLVNPVAEILGINRKHPNKVIFGFLPFWNMDEADNLRYHLLTHVAYFGLDYNPDGTIHTLTEDHTTEPGWHKLSSQEASQIFRSTKSAGGKSVIVMRAMTQKLIESLVNNPDNRQQVIDSTMEVYESKSFDGINIDFEYVGNPDDRTKNNFALLVKELSTTCKSKHPECEITIDVFADSAVKNRLWDYAQITPHTDYVIIMAYDFFRPSSTQAGPVAPLRGTCSKNPDQPVCLEYDVAQTIADFTKIIPADKIILGVPYYGYQWQTASKSFLSNTYDDTGSTATYKRIQELISDYNNKASDAPVLGLSTNWDDTTLTPWISFTDSQGNIQQIHYEDERSLSLKYDLVNQSDIAGIAIWALGYDGNWPQLWQLLQQKFTH